MLEFLLSTSILVGAVNISPTQTQYEVLTDEGEIVTVVEDNYDVR